ncbi:MAG: ANTAR domain-containing protein [Clostridia bacterium]|nr:ANTAR domain-containing protein [Clostridia bacterium]
MPLQQRIYSVLLVSASRTVTGAIRERLQPSLFSPVRVEQDVGSAKRALDDRSYDIVIVNSPLPDDAGVRFAIDAVGGAGTVALLLIRAEFFDETSQRVSEHGVFTVSKPVSGTLLDAALNWLISARERLRKTEKKTLTLEEKMEEIRIVNRAKWLLIERRGMDEPSAHRFIEKQAMDRCVTRRTVAEEILGTASGA